ncbi:MAG: hypothetical protein Q9184_007220 [Pyrenodesmia sp. 2 TL-2023]
MADVDSSSEGGESQRGTVDDEADDMEALLQALQFLYEDRPQEGGDYYHGFLQAYEDRAQDTDHPRAIDTSWPMADEELAVDDDDDDDVDLPHSVDGWVAYLNRLRRESPNVPRNLWEDDFPAQETTLPTSRASPADTPSSQRSFTATTSSTASTVFAVRASPTTHREIRIRREGPIPTINTRPTPSISTSQHRSSHPSSDATERVSTNLELSPPLRRAPRLPSRRHSANNTDEDRRRGNDMLVRRGGLGPLIAPDDDEWTGFRIRGAASRDR